MCEILVDMDKIFKIYIHPPIGQQLLFIIERLKDLIGIQQIANVIDDTPIIISAIQQDYGFLRRFYSRNCSFNMVM